MDKITFDAFNIAPEIKQAVTEMGFEEATTIQTQAIPLILEGKDVIGHSQTGTGKTAAFGIPSLQIVDRELKKLQVLVLCPTRELAIQASEEIRKYGRYMRGINVLPIYGGQSIDRQIKALKRGVQIVIGTPGRVMDHMRRRTLRMNHIKLIILDEADEMLSMGFREDIETILQDVPEERQTLLFSATMPKPILDLTRRYQRNPELVTVVHKQLTVPSIEQYYFEVRGSQKLEGLTRLIDIYNPHLSLIFCNTKRKVDELANELIARGYAADGLHGDLRQAARDRVMHKFRSGVIDILVATDVAARGIDVDDIDIVFNYDVPLDEEYYVHRIGRTGRAGRTGMAFTFVSGRREIYAIKDIQRYIKMKIQRKRLPTVNDVEQKTISLFLDKIRSMIDEGELETYHKILDQLMEEDYTSVDIAAALLKHQLGEIKNANKPQETIDFGNTGAEPGMVRFFINVGRKDHVRPGDIVRSIAENTGVPGSVIGIIDIYEKFTFVEVPRDNAAEILTIMKNSRIKGRSISIEPAKAKN